MSANENRPMPDGASSAPAVPVRRSALLGPQEGGWVEVPEFAPPPEAPPAGASLSVYLHGLRHHWGLATSLGLLCAALLGAAVWIGWGPRYTASAYLRIAPSKPVVVFTTAETESQRFTQNAFDIYKDTQAQLLRNPRVLTAALRTEVSFKEQKMKAGQLPSIQWAEYWGDPIVWLEKKLKVDFPGKAEIMEVSMTGEDEEEMTRLVNAVVDAYWKEVVVDEQVRRQQRLSELDRIYTDKEQGVKDTMGNVRLLADSMGTVDPEALRLKEQMAVQRLGIIQRERFQTRVLLERARGELEGQRALLASADFVEIPEIDVEDYLNSHLVTQRLYSDLSFRMMTIAGTEANISPASMLPFARRHTDEANIIRDQIDKMGEEARKKIRAKNRAEYEAAIRQLEVQVRVLSDQEQQLAGTVTQQEEETEKLTKTSIELQMMRSKIADLELTRTGIAEERERLNVELRSQSRLTLIQPAEPPKVAANRVARIALTILAVIAGLCVPIGSVAWWDTRAERINSSADVSERLGLTVLGSIPMVPTRVVHQLGSSSKRHQNWHLRLTESVDGIAARLLRQAELEQTHVLLVSSASSSEGKTTLATQLAMSFARSGRRTVLVDFDLRRPAFDGVFGLPLEPGVSEVLRGESDASEVVHETGADNLSVLTAGRWNRNALTALANGAAGSLFEKLRAEYEFVVVDATPILPVADTRLVSQHVDAVILSVFRDVSQAPKIMAACEILEAFGVRTLEAVVTGPSDNLRDKDLKYESSLST